MTGCLWGFGELRDNIKQDCDLSIKVKFTPRIESVYMKKLNGHRTNRNGFTLIELLVVIAIIALLMAILIPALSKARKHAKSTICLSNCKQLLLGWTSYAETYDGKLVNGGQAQYPPPTDTNPADYARIEPFWNSGFPTVKIPNYSWAWDLATAGGAPILTLEQRVEKLKEGALYKYLKDVKIFKCPEAINKEYHQTYSIVQSMNSKWEAMSSCCGSQQGPLFRNLAQIKIPQERIVFVEEGNPSPNGFMVYYTREGWCDLPQAPHVKAANFGCADGHAELWKWVDRRTLSFVGGEKGDWSDPKKPCPDCDYDPPGNKDLQRVQIGTYGGELAYTPKPTPPGNNIN